MKDKYKLSVIIPLYNTPKDYFTDCLQSISDQKFTKKFMEVIVIDDCSTEDYSDIYNEFPDLNLRIERLEENSGPGTARHRGVDLAAGKYITFIDSDDQLLDSTSLHKLMDATIKHPELDLICGKVVEQLADGSLKHHIKGYVWCFAKLFKREFLIKNQINFNDTRANEDNAFCTLCALTTEKIGWLEDYVYFWRFQPESITRKNNHEYEFKQFHMYIENMIWVYNEAKKRGIEEKKNCLYQYCGVWIRIYFHFLQAFQDKRPAEAIKVIGIANYFYNEVYSKYKDKIIGKIFENQWSNMVETSALNRTVFNVSFPEFEYRAINNEQGGFEPKFNYYIR